MNDLIARTRPREDALAAEFGPAAAAPTWESGVRRVRRRPNRLALLAVAAVVLALALSMPVLLPGWRGTPASAVALNAAATKAGERPALLWADGQFLHTRSVSVQDDNEAALPPGRVPVHNRIVRDDWMAPDGWLWSRRADAAGDVEWCIFGPSSGWLRPGYAVTMPTEPHALDLFLRARVSGSASQDEAVFVAIGDMLKAEAAPPALRAGAIRVLGLNPMVAVTSGQDSSGRTALIATYVDEARRPGARQLLYLDPDTGDLLGETHTETEGTYESVVQVREVVDALPAEVVAALGSAKVERRAGAAAAGPGAEQPSPGPSATPVDPTSHPSETYTPAPTGR